MATVFGFGMAGCLFSLGSMGDPLGLRALGKALVIFRSVLLGGTLLMCSRKWQLAVGFDALASTRRVAAEPDVWTDGSLVEDKVSGASSAGHVVSLIAAVVFGRIGGGGHLDQDVGEDAVVSACPGFLLFSTRVHCSLFKGLSFGVLFLLCKLMMG